MLLGFHHFLFGSKKPLVIPADLWCCFPEAVLRCTIKANLRGTEDFCDQTLISHCKTRVKLHLRQSMTGKWSKSRPLRNATLYGFLMSVCTKCKELLISHAGRVQPIRISRFQSREPKFQLYFLLSLLNSLAQTGSESQSTCNLAVWQQLGRLQQEPPCWLPWVHFKKPLHTSQCAVSAFVLDWKTPNTYVLLYTCCLSKC